MTHWRLGRTIVLVGMMGAGKTAVGTQLARELGVPFLDSDDEIVKAANMSIPEIFARDGEAFFRERESEVIERLLAEAPCVLSTGGGAFISARNRAAIARDGLSIWLKADVDLLWSRVRNRTHRPLLQTENPRQVLADLLATREPVYAEAQLTVTCAPDLHVEAMVGRVIDTLSATRPDVLSTI